MPNQYSKVELTLDLKMPQDITLLKKQYTKALFELLKNKIPQTTDFTNDLIKTVKEGLD
jgi:hypothetical protein